MEAPKMPAASEAVMTCPHPSGCSLDGSCSLEVWTLAARIVVDGGMAPTVATRGNRRATVATFVAARPCTRRHKCSMEMANEAAGPLPEGPAKQGYGERKGGGLAALHAAGRVWGSVGRMPPLASHGQ